jgi:hypothetical protein
MLAVLIAIPLAAPFAAGCSSNGGGPTGPEGGPVTGALDMHCRDADGGVTAVVVGACMPGGETDAGEPPDGGAVSEYGATLFNAEGDDDECKYHVKWTATPIRQNTNVTFTVTLTKLADMTAATEAGMHAEVFLNDTHPAQPPPEATESGGGTYKLGPVRFDAPGDWTVRFHFYEDCNDVPENSPHGHAAFFVRVPNPASDGGAG